MRPDPGGSGSGRQPLLAVEHLTVAFPTRNGPIPVVRDVSFEIGAGEFVGLVGESGSGKTMTALALLRLVPSPGSIAGGRILLGGRDLMDFSERQMRCVRGARLAMVFQEPARALNPVFTIGFQICEAIRAHSDVSRAEARREAARLLELVSMPEAERRLDDYPHQISGGQRQRVMIAIALAAGPDLLLADEPTTALDVTVQAQILELLDRLRRELGLAVLLITHDLAVVAEACDRVAVMYAGEIVEEAAAGALFSSPAHPYTRGLLAALPRLGDSASLRGRLQTIPGQVADLHERPSGCSFHPRCAEVMPRCREEAPREYLTPEGRRARCFLLGEAARSI